MGLLAVAAAGLVTSPAAAFPTSRLTYVRNKGSEGCPAEAQVRAEVAARLGYDPFFVWAERTIVAQLFRDGSGYHATVQLLDDQGVVRGSRALQSPKENCAELIKAVALAISIGIDPDHGTEPRAISPSPAPDASPVASEPAPTAKSEKSEATSVSARPTSAAPPLPVSSTMTSELGAPSFASASLPTRLEVRGGAGLFSAINLAPALAVGGAVYVGLAWKYALLDVELRKTLPASDRDVDVDLLAATLLPCGRYGVFYGCGAASWGRLHVQGERTVNTKYVGLGARLGAVFHLSSQMILRGYAEGLASLDRTLVLSNKIAAWQLPATSIGLGSDLAVSF